MSGHKTFDGWQPIKTAPKGANGTAFMMLAFGPPGDQTVSEGIHHQGRFYAASVFHVGGSHGERQFAFREHEVHPTHWRPTLAPPSPAETASEREKLVAQAAIIAEAAYDDRPRNRSEDSRWNEGFLDGTRAAAVAIRAALAQEPAR